MRTTTVMSTIQKTCITICLSMKITGSNNFLRLKLGEQEYSDVRDFI